MASSMPRNSIDVHLEVAISGASVIHLTARGYQIQVPLNRAPTSVLRFLCERAMDANGYTGRFVTPHILSIYARPNTPPTKWRKVERASIKTYVFRILDLVKEAARDADVPPNIFAGLIVNDPMFGYALNENANVSITIIKPPPIDAEPSPKPREGSMP